MPAERAFGVAVKPLYGLIFLANAESIWILHRSFAVDPATYFYHWNNYHLYDDASLTSGRHSLKVGAVFERIQLNSMGLSNPSGVWSFSNLKTFLTNVPSKFTSGFANTLSPPSLRQSLAGAYIQDDWSLRPNFTLNNPSRDNLC